MRDYLLENRLSIAKARSFAKHFINDLHTIHAGFAVPIPNEWGILSDFELEDAMEFLNQSPKVQRNEAEPWKWEAVR